MSNVAVFDLDGTLTDTSAVDGECFLQALTDTFGIDGQTSDWTVHKDVTDSGILADVVRDSRGTEPDEGERQQFIDCFVTLLHSAYDTNRDQFQEISGAKSFVSQLRNTGWKVSVATGGWRASALRKLEYGGFVTDELPLASANDARKRTDIVQKSLQRAGVHQPSRIVIFGDAIWDVDAARELGLPIIAVAPHPQSHRLREAGAFSAIENYRNPENVLALMHQALATNGSANG